MPLHLARRVFETPVGRLTALASAEGLCALEFDKVDRRTRLEGRRARWFPPHEIDEGNQPALEAIARWLAAFFDGTSADASAVPLQFFGTPFEQSVWRRLLRIPAGETVSYGAIARALACPNGSRAVGLAVGSNPLAIVVPCHRVVGSTGSLTGYGGGLDRKRWLLAHEVRCFGAADPGRLF